MGMILLSINALFLFYLPLFFRPRPQVPSAFQLVVQLLQNSLQWPQVSTQTDRDGFIEISTIQAAQHSWILSWYEIIGQNTPLCWSYSITSNSNQVTLFSHHFCRQLVGPCHFLYTHPILLQKKIGQITFSIVCQMLSWRTKIRPHSINI